MALNFRQREHIVEVCKILAQQEDLKVTIEESGKGAVIIGMGAFVGGVLGGPVGMGVGGVISSVFAAVSAKGKFKSVVEIIDEMTDDQKNRLCSAVKKGLQETRPEEIMGLVTLALTSPSVKTLVVKELGNFFMKELQLQIRF